MLSTVSDSSLSVLPLMGITPFSSFCLCGGIGTYCDDDGGVSSSSFRACGGVGEYSGDVGGVGGDISLVSL